MIFKAADRHNFYEEHIILTKLFEVDILFKLPLNFRNCLIGKYSPVLCQIVRI